MEENLKELCDELLNISIKSTDEIFYSLSMLETALNNSKQAFKKEITKNLEDNDFQKVKINSDFCNQIEMVNKSVNDILHYLSNNSSVHNTYEPSVFEKSTEDLSDKSLSDYKESVDYSKYETNRYECHSLNEDFMHKKICAFELNGEYFNVSSWKHTLIMLCNWAFKNHQNELQSFVNNPDFKGKKNTYFMDKHVPERNKKIGNSNIYVWTNLSANDTVKLIKNILDHLNIPYEQFIVYLRADYTELHS